MSLKQYIIAVLIPLILISCGFPNDPEDSWKNAQEQGLLIGVTDSKQKEAEMHLIKSFCKANSLEPLFIEDTETALSKKLKHHKLHLVLGGFDKKTVWTERVGITKPYDGTHILLIAPGENKLLYELERYLINIKNEKN